MEVHNVLEDIVINKVNEICDLKAERENNERYANYQCRLDVACYVLNRVAPEYVVSSRGIAHIESDYMNRMQLEADLVTLINEGIQKVLTTQRPYAEQNAEFPRPKPKGYFYNFPTIIGRVFNGVNFEPISSAKVYLYENNDLVNMIDPNWQNPYDLATQTAGTFTFWPQPQKTDDKDKRDIVEFEIAIENDKFEPLHHFFRIEVHSENEYIDALHLSRTFKIKDLYLFPK